jgi:alkylation response protein AidB-like acyl-CoA dehydrogenase
MDFSLTETEQEIVRQAERFSKHLRERHRKFEEEGVDEETRRIYNDLGFGSLDLSPEEGGLGLPLYVKLLVVETLAFGCGGSTLSLDLPFLSRKVGEYLLFQDRDRFFQNLTGDSFGFVFGGEERVGWEKEGELFFPFVLGTGWKKVLLIEEDRLLLLRPRKVEKVRPLGIQAVGGSRVEGVEVEEEFPFSEKGRDFFLSYLRLYQTALLSGIGKASYEYAKEYTLNREAFGRKIAHHQAISFLLSEMHFTMEAVHLYMLSSSIGGDEGGGKSLFTASHQSFLFAVERVIPLTVMAVQLLGGHGFVQDHPVEKWMRDARAVASLFGGPVSAEEFLVKKTNIIEGVAVL